MINATSGSQMLYGCSSLETVTIKNIKINLGLQENIKLTTDSLIGICKECINTNSSKKLTIGTENTEKLANIYVRLTNESEEDANNPKLPCEVCSSSDSGAMTISAYMTLKN